MLSRCMARVHAASLLFVPSCGVTLHHSARLPVVLLQPAKVMHRLLLLLLRALPHVSEKENVSLSSASTKSDPDCKR